MAGMNPATASEINNDVGLLLRAFIDVQQQVHHFQVSLAALDLTAAPYSMTAADQNTIKSAINGLDTSLQGINMTFINQLVGLF